MKKLNNAITFTIVVLVIALSGISIVFAVFPTQLTGGGDNILDPGETLSGNEEWGDPQVVPNGYLEFTVDASASVAGEDITFTYTPIGTDYNGTTYNDSNIALNVSNTANGDSCFQMNFSGTDPVSCTISGATGGGTYVIDVNNNNGSPCDLANLDQPSCDAADFISSMDATATNNSGGAPVPEFSDYMLILTIVIAIAFMFKLLPKASSNLRAS